MCINEILTQIDLYKEYSSETDILFEWRETKKQYRAAFDPDYGKDEEWMWYFDTFPSAMFKILYANVYDDNKDQPFSSEPSGNIELAKYVTMTKHRMVRISQDFVDTKSRVEELLPNGMNYDNYVVIIKSAIQYQPDLITVLPTEEITQQLFELAVESATYQQMTFSLKLIPLAIIENANSKFQNARGISWNNVG